MGIPHVGIPHLGATPIWSWLGNLKCEHLGFEQVSKPPKPAKHETIIVSGMFRNLRNLQNLNIEVVDECTGFETFET